MEIVGRGRILIWEGASLWLMEALPAPGTSPNATAYHAHHAIQVTLSLGGRFALRTQDRSVTGDAVVAADVEHLFEAQGRIAILFIEPESRAGRAVTQTVLGGVPLAAIPEGSIRDLTGRLGEIYGQSPADEPALENIGRMLVERLTGGVVGSIPDPRVRKMMSHVASRLDGAVSLESAASAAGLSPSRARHLFVEQTGLAFRSYLLWLRMTRAVQIMSSGRSLTEAAHEAGFADSPHFSRTFRRMFGIPAASLQIT
jgi:AraC-like DNA-binding protein